MGIQEPTLTDVYDRLGRLTEGVSGLREDLAEAREDRKELTSRVDDWAARTAKLEATIARLEPTVDTVSTALAGWRNKVAGGLMVIGILAGFLGWAVGIFLTELKLWFFRVFGGH